MGCNSKVNSMVNHLLITMNSTVCFSAREVCAAESAGHSGASSCFSHFDIIHCCTTLQSSESCVNVLLHVSSLVYNYQVVRHHSSKDVYCCGYHIVRLVMMNLDLGMALYSICSPCISISGLCPQTSDGSSGLPQGSE